MLLKSHFITILDALVASNRYGAEVSADYPSGAEIRQFKKELAAERTRRNNSKCYQKRKADNAQLMADTYIFCSPDEREGPEVEILPDSACILFWNIHGLNSNKITQICDFISHFDIVCLTETWVLEENQRKFEALLPEKFQCRIVSIYRTPGKVDLITTQLEAVVRDKLRVIVGGDFNARVGHHGSAVANGVRPTRDPFSNGKGKALAAFWKGAGLQLLNGNVDGDLHGELTYMPFRSSKAESRPRNSSTIDYVWAKNLAGKSLTILRPPDILKIDHSALSVAINM